MLSAARHALASGKVAVAPCSGFHHAGYQQSEGFCTFNGLMVVERALEAELHNIRQVVAQQNTEIAALRHQLAVYDRLGMSTAVGGLQKVWALRRRGGRT